jgi:hypothetical protein
MTESVDAPAGVEDLIDRVEDFTRREEERFFGGRYLENVDDEDCRRKARRSAHAPGVVEDSQVGTVHADTIASQRQEWIVRPASRRSHHGEVSLPTLQHGRCHDNVPVELSPARAVTLRRKA